MSQPRILISGASVASPALHTGGDTARDVLKRMDIFDLRSKSSQEEGIQVIGLNNKIHARFGIDTSGDGNSITPIEILRSKLAGIPYDVTREHGVHFWVEVETLLERGDEIEVWFKNGTEKKILDLVIAADGLGSPIRGTRMVFGKVEANIRSLNSYIS